MNSLKNYFSPTKLSPSPVKVLQQTPSSSNGHESVECEMKNGLKPQVSKLSKADSRQIVSNMESVINSVKKKHRHRKKKDNVELNKSEPEITDISNILSNSLKFISPNTSVESGKTVAPEAKENVAENEKKNKYKTRKSKKIKELKPEAKSRKNGRINKDDDVEIVVEKDQNAETMKDSKAIVNVGKTIRSKKKDVVDSCDREKPEEKCKVKTNAFTLMMNARNRVIGSNQNGQDISKDSSTSPCDPEKTKRKLMLQEWAERKGGAKRKLDEVMRDEYLDQQMEKRAKRLKRMLTRNKDASQTTKNTSKNSNIADSVDVLLISSQDSATEQDKSLKSRPRKAKGNKSVKKEESASIPEPKNSLNVTPSKSTSRTLVSRRKQIVRAPPIQSEVSNPESEDNGFVQKLSSPIKKRDSLLGYFPKITSPQMAETTSEKISPKVKSTDQLSLKNKRHRKEVNNLKEETNSGTVTSDLNCETTSGRLRRSCAGRVCYDEEVLMYPQKYETTAQSKRRKSISACEVKTETEMKMESDCVDVICLDATDDNVSEKKSTKLAPVFIKNVPKPAIDPAILQARKEFLMSGIPERLKLELAKQKQFEESFEFSLESLFPKISHVGRDEREKSVEKNKIADWEKCGVIWRDIHSSPDRPIKPENAANLMPLTPLKSPLAALERLSDVENKVDVIKNLKASYKKFPTYRCYKQLRAKYKQTENLAVQQVSDSFVILNTHNTAKEDFVDFSGNGDQLFTEKYKPMASDQVLVNFHPVNKLKDFLANWQSGKYSKFDESSNDFDCSNDSICSAVCNTVVLHGPSSSGKTNAVFALANEMNFNVLEINAGMKRNGKKLLQELQEATQSHLVSNDKPSLFKKTLSGPKYKIADSNESSSTSELSASSKLSLILVEDADIVFEQDSGFIDALNQLIATSKRPVIIVSNSADCPYLLRLQKQSGIEFPAPNVLNISKFLSVMSLVENCPVELDDIIRLYLYNKQNLRKTLLEMQFFIQSGGDRIRIQKTKPTLQSPQKFLKEDDLSVTENVADDTESTHNPISEDVYIHQSLFDFYTINQNSNYLIEFPINFECLYNNLSDIIPELRSELLQPKKRGRKPKNPIPTKQFSDSLNDIVQFYENISVASYISTYDNDDRLADNIGEVIAHTLAEKTLRLKLSANTKLDHAPRNTPKRHMLSHLLSQTSLRTNRSIDMDLEPALRMICRSEKARSLVERRGSRFYHYLRNICTSTISFSTEMFEGSCSVLDTAANDESNSKNGISKND